MDSPTDPTDNETPRRRLPKWLMWGAIGLITIVVVGYGLIFLYAKVINDSPDELGTDDLAAALEASSDDATDATSAATMPPTTTATGESPATATAETEPPTTEPLATEPPTTEPLATEPPTTEPPTTESPTDDAPVGSGDWVVTDPSELGYRVKEILFGVDTEAVGRTDQIDGTMTIEDATVTAAEFTVDVASISSDESRRDNQFRGRIMSTDEFPTATFALTEPIELGAAPADGVQVETTATGDLTLRGVTNPVTFDITAEQANGRVAVLGQIPVLFADYEIANPSLGGITTEDNGLLEFVLAFEPA